MKITVHYVGPKIDYKLDTFPTLTYEKEGMDRYGDYHYKITVNFDKLESLRNSILYTIDQLDFTLM